MDSEQTKQKHDIVSSEDHTELIVYVGSGDEEKSVEFNVNGVNHPNTISSVASATVQNMVSITEIPSLRIHLRMKLPDGCALNGIVVYKGYIEYTDHSRQDRSDQFSISSSSLDTVLNLDHLMVGGIIHITIDLPLRLVNGTTMTKQLVSNGTITGENPSKATIQSELGSDELRVIAYKESRFRQFGSDSLPLFGPPRGFGVMQIDTPPATYRQIWDWKENVRAGKALLELKKREVDQHYRNIFAAHPTAPQLSADQSLLALFQYYNGGHYWKWNESKSAWEKLTNSPYADDAKRIYDQVKAGSFPTDWN